MTQQHHFLIANDRIHRTSTLKASGTVWSFSTLSASGERGASCSECRAGWGLWSRAFQSIRHFFPDLHLDAQQPTQAKAASSGGTIRRIFMNWRVEQGEIREISVRKSKARQTRAVQLRCWTLPKPCPLPTRFQGKQNLSRPFQSLIFKFCGCSCQKA